MEKSAPRLHAHKKRKQSPHHSHEQQKPVTRNISSCNRWERSVMLFASENAKICEKNDDSTGQDNHLGKLPSLPIQPMSPTNGRENPGQHTLTLIMKQVPVCIPDSILAQSAKKNIEANSQVCPQTLFAAKKITLPAQQITNLSNKSWNWDVRRLISREGRLGAPGGLGPSRICVLFR